jgi:plasmid maintenance system antidote protein VapI
MVSSRSSLGELLRSTNRTQASLARDLQIHPSSISRWVNGNRPIPKHHRVNITKALGVELQALGPRPKETD